MRKVIFNSLVAALFLTATSIHAAVVTVGNVVVPQGNTIVQLDIMVTGGEAAAGMNFSTTIADGGPDLGGVVTAPVFVFNPAANTAPGGPKGGILLTGPGMVFGANNTGQSLAGNPFFPLYAFDAVTTATGTVPLNGLLGSLFIDITGAAPGFYPVQLEAGGGAEVTQLLDVNAGVIPSQLIAGGITIQGIINNPDPIDVTVTPPGGNRGNGDTINVANAVAPANGRDSAQVQNVVLTQGLNGLASIGPGLAGPVDAGNARGTAVAIDDSGLLNNTPIHATLDFVVAGGPNGPGTGGGPYHFDLTGIASGNSGDQASRIAPGGSVAGLFGVSDKAVGGVVEFLGGTNTDVDTRTARARWRNRNANETEPGGTTPPLPTFATELISDVVDVTGLDGQVHVLQMTYDPSKLNASEATAQSLGILFLASFDTSDGLWKNAVALNSGNDPGALTNFNGSWAAAGSPLSVGSWGVDTANNRAWAVINHNSEFAVVPEPSTFILGGLAAMIVAACFRRGRQR
jgi:hypothetical protein